MASLDQHIRTPDPEAHARLPFRADCPACRRLRLTGALPPPEIVPRRAKVGIVAGVLAASGLSPGAMAAAQASPTGGGDGEEQVLPPGGVAQEEGGSEPALPPGTNTDSPGPGVPPVAAPEAELTPPAAVPEYDEPSRSEAPPPPTTQPAPAPTPRPDSGPHAERRPAPEAHPENSPSRGGAPPPAATEDDGSDPRDAEPRGAGRPDGSDRGAGLTASPRPQAEPRRGGAERAEAHVVRAGESLWLIAERRLGEGASDAQIATEVNRLWELNDTETIRTGDPDLIHPGQELRL